MPRSLALCLLCVAATLIRAQTNETPLAPAEIARRTFPSVVLLIMNDQRGQPFCIGSGFFIDQDIVATNFHVIAQTGGGFAKIPGQRAKFTIKGIVGIDAVRDLALLQLEPVTAPPLSLATQLPVNIGDAVYVVGNPEGFEATFSQGIISGFREIGPARLIQMTAPISPGSSGGPVLDQTGRVMGVSVGGAMHGENLNFAIPAEYLVALQQHRTELRAFRSVPEFDLAKTALGRLGGQPPRTAIIGENFSWSGGGGFNKWGFSYSLHNTLHSDVAKIRGFVIFYDLDGHPIDTFAIDCKDTIPAQSAKRLTGEVDQSVWQLSRQLYWWDSSQKSWHKGSLLSVPDHLRRSTKFEKRQGKVEFRVLDFAVL